MPDDVTKLGVTYSGRTVYGCTIRGEYGYAATDAGSSDVITNENWDEFAWWRWDCEWVQIWLKEITQQSQDGINYSRNADHIDGYDRDDLGESPDY